MNGNGKDTIHEAFTVLAPEYEQTMDRELEAFLGVGYGEFVDWLVDIASPRDGDVVLDVATGTALIPCRVAERIGTKGAVVGLDITPAMLKRGRKNIKAAGASSRICLVCASGMAMPFVAGVYDVVLCGFGTHHMDVPTMLTEMRRVLKAGGKLILAAVGAPPHWRSLLAKTLLRVLLPVLVLSSRSARVQAEVEAFSNVRTAQEWQAVLSDTGFTEIDVAESPACRPWYPCALTIRAAAGRTQS